MHAHADPGPSARDRAFERLYRRYVPDVYRYTLAVLRNPADAEDITQTTFMNAYRAYRRGEEPLKPQNWLIKIAHNACRTRYLRASRRPVEVPLEHSLRELAVPVEEIPNVREVLDALANLPFNQRAALVMRELEGRSYAEIAQALDVSVSAVETLIFRARRALRVRRSALRSLAALPMPASLTSFSSGGAAIGGGALVGTGVLLKAVLAVGVGVVAGTAGTAVEAKLLQPDRGAAQAAPPIAARNATPGALRGSPARTSAGAGAGRLVSGRALDIVQEPPSGGLFRRTSLKPPHGAFRPAPGRPAASSPSAAAPTESPPAERPASTVTETVAKTVPAPPVPVPTVSLPVVTPPAVPDPPELPLPVEPPPPPALPPPPSLP